MNNNSILWSKILEKLKKEVSSLSFQTWFEETELYKIENGIAKIIVPYAIHKDHLTNHYKDQLKSYLIEETGEPIEIEFYTKEEIEEDPVHSEREIAEEENKNDFYTEIKDTNYDSHLNKNYTFDNFVVGNSNKFAHAAALAVAEKPSQMYHLLFIYGNSGLGKTHLMHAIGNYIEKTTNLKVLYVTSETFSTEFIEISRKKNDKSDFDKIDLFKRKYRDIDVLIIDDIQYLAKREESTKEFFFTFESLMEGKKQIIISSDRSPNDLKAFEDRLRTRFSWGLTVNIYPPDNDLKIAILKKKIKAEAINKEIPENVIEYMAANLGTDIRTLEGSLNRLLAYSTMMGAEITLQLAVEALKDFLHTGFSADNDIGKVQKIVADYFKISIEDLKSKKRNANIAFPRQIAMYLCRKHTEESFDRIGIEFGGKDHSTVMHSCKKLEQEMRVNQSIKEAVEKMEKDLSN